MAKFRMVWVKCPDCGRHGVDGGCYVVERRSLFRWQPFITSFDRAGVEYPFHFQSMTEALRTFREVLKPHQPSSMVVLEWTDTN